MRRIGMKGCKRRKSDTSSDADSGENGGATTHNSEEVDGNSVEAEESPASTPAATPNKKRSRGRPKRESEAANAGSDGEAEDADDTVGEQENGNASKSESKSESKGETKSESKKRKKGKQKPSTSQEKPAEEDEYEVSNRDLAKWMTAKNGGNFFFFFFNLFLSFYFFCRWKESLDRELLKANANSLYAGRDTMLTPILGNRKRI